VPWPMARRLKTCLCCRRACPEKSQRSRIASGKILKPRRRR
jgi:hypothetical protein